MIFTSLTQRLTAWFALVSLLPIMVITLGLLRTYETELRITVAGKVSAVADKKVDQIDSYLNTLVQDLTQLLQGNAAPRAMREFTRVFTQSGVQSPEYRQLDAAYRGYFQRFIENAGYYDLFLISPQGTVVYSQTHESDFATSMLTGPYRDSGLAKAVRNTLKTLESNISEFEFYAPSNNAIAAFVTVPILNRGKIEGVLAIQIDSHRLFQVLTDNAGLGFSGETMVARRTDEQTALVMVPLVSNPAAALRQKIQLSEKIRAAPLVSALKGVRGSGFAVDFEGKSVVAAWRYLPRMDWGLVAKIDAAEALAPVQRLRAFSLAILTFALVIALLGGVLLGRRIVIPLKAITHSAREMAAGNLLQRVPFAGRDELGQLVGSFNTMAERLQSSQEHLEQQVVQRTAALTQALQQEQSAQLALKEFNENLEQRVAQRTAELEQARDNAERASRAKSDFLSRMSHELRTPMNAILGFGQLLEFHKDHPLDPVQHDNVREILRAGRHLLELINEVLDLARIESGRLELDLEPVPLAHIMETSLAQIRPLAEARHISINIEANGKDCIFTADPLRLRQVLLNLLSNAVKYNRDNGSIRVTCAPAQEGWARLAVHDTGRGISAEGLARLFRPFERLESAYDAIDGTGIGLALSKRLVEAMGGRIGVDSVPGEGSTFWVELPLSTVTAVAASADTSQAMPDLRTARTLLYVEDDPANLRLMQRIIGTHSGWTLLDAHNAELGLELAFVHRPDLILMDINLPGLSGFEALQRLRAHPATRNTPVIAITANAMPRDIERGRAAGFSDYLTKPLDVPQFLNVLDQTVRACTDKEDQ